MADEAAPTPPKPQSGRLTDDQKEKIQGWFAKHKPPEGIACPICRSLEWTVLPDLVTPMRFQGGALVIGGASYPHFGLVCRTCSNTQFINAVVTGIIEPPERPKRKPDDTAETKPENKPEVAS